MHRALDAVISHAEIEDAWKTVHGTHIEVDNNGQVVKGPSALKSAASSKSGVTSYKQMSGRTAGKAISTQRLRGQVANAITSYASGSFAGINSALRTGNISPNTQVSISHISEAIKASTVQEPLQVFRFEEATPEYAANLATLKPGDTISKKTFTSTTRDADRMRSMADMGYKVSTTIDLPVGTAALDVNKAVPSNEQSDEEEVLLQHGQNYRVVSAINKGDDAWDVHLEAVPSKYGVAKVGDRERLHLALDTVFDLSAARGKHKKSVQ
jgi:hypothetical protein